MNKKTDKDTQPKDIYKESEGLIDDTIPGITQVTQEGTTQVFLTRNERLIGLVELTDTRMLARLPGFGLPVGFGIMQPATGKPYLDEKLDAVLPLILYKATYYPGPTKRTRDDEEDTPRARDKYDMMDKVMELIPKVLANLGPRIVGDGHLGYYKTASSAVIAIVDELQEQEENI